MNLTTRAPYELLVIGSGPAGQGAALQAAASGRCVAVVERAAVGGVSTSSGTIPAHTLRAAIVGLGTPPRGRQLLMDDLLWRMQPVSEHESDATLDRFRRSGVRVLQGTASFADPHTIEVRHGGTAERVRAKRIVLAVGSVPHRPASIAFDGHSVLDSDEIGLLRNVPRTVVVVGGGRIGLEYASMFAALGVRVTVVERRPRLLGHVDDGLAEALQYHLRGHGVEFRVGRHVTTAEHDGAAARVRLDTGETLRADVVLVAAGRDAATADLAPAVAGLAADDRGRLAVDHELRTAQRHVFAVGPADTVAAASDQGRRAALAAFGEPLPARSPLPDALYTIPELSCVGPTQQELTRAGTPYVAGVASYRDLLRAGVAGDRVGLLKLLVHAGTRQLLGVHALGTNAAELVHVGQVAIAGRLPVDYFADAAFNAPTLGEAYSLAARDAAAGLRIAEPAAANAA